MPPGSDRAITIRILGDAAGLSAALNKSWSDLGNFERQAEKLGKTIRAGSLIAATAVLGIGAAALKTAGDFDNGMREINTLLNLPQEGFEKLSQQALDLSKEIGVLPDKVIPALYQALSSGVSQDNVFDFVRIASQASIGGIADLSVVVDTLTSSIAAFSRQGLTAQQAADSMFTAVALGKTTFAELAASMGQIAPIAAAAGINFDELTGGIAALTLQGFGTSDAITGMRSAITGLLSPSEDLTKIFKAAGFESQAAAVAQLGLQGALQLVNEAANGEIGTMATLLGRVEAVNAALGLTGPNAEAFNAVMDAMANKTGATAKAFEEMEKSSGRAMERLKTQAYVALITLGNEILPHVTAAADRFGLWWTQHEPQISEAANAIREAFAAFFRDFTIGLSVIGPPLLRFFDYVRDLPHVVDAMIIAMVAIGAAVLMTVAPIITGIALIGHLKNNWRDAANAIIGYAENMANGVIEAINPIMDKIGDFIEGVAKLPGAAALGIQQGQIFEGGVGRVTLGRASLGGGDDSGAFDSHGDFGGGGSTVDAIMAKRDAERMAAQAAASAALGGPMAGLGGGAGGGGKFELERLAERQADEVREAWMKGGQSAVDATRATQADLNVKWEQIRADAAAAGIKLTDQERLAWEERLTAISETTQRHTAEIAEAWLLGGDLAVRQTRNYHAQMDEEWAIQIDRAKLRGIELTEADRTMWEKRKELAAEGVRAALEKEQELARQRGADQARAAFDLTRQLWAANPNISAESARHLADVAKQAAAQQFAQPVVQQTISVTVEDGSPPAIARAVTMAGEHMGNALALEMAGAG